ncbi:MAG TPA: isochorismatase family protein [Myxococcales bacterium]|jgi:nicotinamidase-related amidase|nr:isochorismatase family protein [Myxococcales bacterium]
MRSEGTTASTLALDRADALLMVIDVQEKLSAAMPKAPFAELERNAAVLIRAARRLEIPVIATEQYPKGLGPTVASLRELLPQEPMSKMEFSCGASKPIARHVLGSGRKQVVVVGMEAHVCVFQTVRDLLRGGFSVFVAQDAVVSRSEANRDVGLRLCEKAGATLTSTETVLFDLLGVAGTPEFKELTALIK